MLQDINIGYTKNSDRTLIYRMAANNEIALGYLDKSGVIYRLRWEQGVAVGRVTNDNKILRHTRYDERELGSFNEKGTVFSSGVLEGGALGWVEADGIVVRAGFIFGEEEVGRAEGDMKIAAGAALLLLFLVDEQEETNRSRR
jgi:hypothetical protein